MPGAPSFRRVPHPFASFAKGWEPQCRTETRGLGAPGFDGLNRLTSETTPQGAISYTYDNANRRQTMTLPNGIVLTYGYDNDSRISGLTYKLGTNTVGNLTYQYDAAGRRTQLGGSLAASGFPTAVSSATYDVANELTNWNGATITYDANGNLQNDGTNTYSWNARNQLTGISGGLVNACYLREDPPKYA